MVIRLLRLAARRLPFDATRGYAAAFRKQTEEAAIMMEKQAELLQKQAEEASGAMGKGILWRT